MPEIFERFGDTLHCRLDRRRRGDERRRDGHADTKTFWFRARLREEGLRSIALRCHHIEERGDVIDEVPHGAAGRERSRIRRAVRAIESTTRRLEAEEMTEGG